jgi:hypothetical protein
VGKVKFPNWPRCPKCNSQKVEVVELWKSHSVAWGPGDADNEGNLDPGDPYRVEGKCQGCGHKWKFRGIIQVDRDWWKEEEEPSV